MKPFYRSKTFWFGTLFVLNSVAQALGYGDFVPSGELSEITSLGVGVLIWGLRYITNQPITIRGEKS